MALFVERVTKEQSEHLDAAARHLHERQSQDITSRRTLAEIRDELVEQVRNDCTIVVRFNDHTVTEVTVESSDSPAQGRFVEI